ncbi:hypothetical protein AAG747_26995 [Rapidithrix thailandica]|uniref:Uncharacterized protein n=1 Tax=Rapidithrix thailandica TaxID=413964 RepID=A0AAW9SL48_9BACT
MKVNYSVKQMGKKHPLITTRSIEIEEIGESPLLKVLIEAVVRQQVKAYNERKAEKTLVDYLKPSDINEQKEQGKVGFGDFENDNQADEEKAIATALQAFEDGIFCVFVDEEQVGSLQDTVTLQPESILYFIRLTFLSGSIW